MATHAPLVVINGQVTRLPSGDTIKGGGSAITVSDEGSQLTATATSLNFVGAGVTATNTGGAVTVTIPGNPTITVATTAPASPSVGDIWVDIS